MNKNKKAFKGFTLIELIIVLAIFSVIMVLVMSFIDPVSRLMTKTSIRERTAAYVDNIGEYIDKSIRPAQNIVVYEHGLYSKDYTADSCTEEIVVRDFVDTYYDGAIDENSAPLTGKVHVLKLINSGFQEEGVYDLESGKIYESVYDFTAGCGKPGNVYIDPSSYNEVDVTGWTEDQITAAGYSQVEKRTYDGINFNHASVTVRARNKSVINDEHFEDYSYYYKLGMQTFSPITNLSEYTPLDGEPAIVESPNAKYFYSAITSMKDSLNSPFSTDPSIEQFVVNVVSFMNDSADNKIDCKYHEGDADEEAVTVFKSPSNMSSVGMTLKNAEMHDNAIKFYRIKRDASGDPEKDDDGVTDKIEKVINQLGVSAFREITDTYYGPDDARGNNIYIVYAVSSEIKDTEWEDISDMPPTTAPGGYPPPPI